MVETNSSMNSMVDKSLTTSGDKSSLDKIVELQDQLLQAQERNLILSAQARELERTVRDAEDLQAEMVAQGLILADKTRENKSIHQELSRVTATLESKLKELEDLSNAFVDLQHQLKTRELERDRLTVMLDEMEKAHKRTRETLDQTATALKLANAEREAQQTTGNNSWLRHIMRKDS